MLASFLIYSSDAHLKSFSKQPKVKLGHICWEYKARHLKGFFFPFKGSESGGQQPQNKGGKEYDSNEKCLKIIN